MPSSPFIDTHPQVGEEDDQCPKDTLFGSSTRLRRVGAARQVSIALVLALSSAATAPAQFTRISVSTSGAQCPAGAAFAGVYVTPDAAKVVFLSTCTVLTPDGQPGLFVWDRASREITRIGLSSLWRESSTDGRHVVDWFAPDGVTIRDVMSGEMTVLPRINWTVGAGQSADGTHVAYFTGGQPGRYAYATHIYVWNQATASVCSAHVSSQGVAGNRGFSFITIPGFGNLPLPDVGLSRDGRFVAFDSWSDNLVPGDENGHRDIFVHDCGTGQTSRVSVDSRGTEANGASSQAQISSDGRYVAFSSMATNLDAQGRPGFFIHDRETAVTRRVGTLERVGL